ncbi:hypothetical protein JCM19241_6099 [Vibrio ishigakensis]|uniref:Uncharacterized protein n=1 Tax=Vibrio ishigakensis TaxID=1481914 RepID=A0A0B8QTD4_9VIBR|nr:hypothetical protein JCM19241_6099 [Vibrio ishigakensis]
MTECKPAQVWDCIVKEARKQADEEPMLASFITPPLSIMIALLLA